MKIGDKVKLVGLNGYRKCPGQGLFVGNVGVIAGFENGFWLVRLEGDEDDILWTLSEEALRVTE